MQALDKGKPNTLFILTVDTEEEWHWDEPFPESDCQVENVQQIPQFQHFCEKIGIRPTYFVDYAVGANDNAVTALRQAQERQQCEIGAHLHPWCNPPYYGPTGEAQSHVVNLPEQQIAAKLDSLTHLLTEKFASQPRSFRTGRWGIDSKVMKLLVSRGYRVDSSMYPYYRNEYFSCEDAPLTPYWPNLNAPQQHGVQRQLMEIPVTAGFNRTSYEFANKLHKLGERQPLKTLHTVGLMWHSRLLRKLYLSPELTHEDDLIRLIDTAQKREHGVIHMYLHSSSLIDGVTGLFDHAHSLDIICERINAAVTHLQSQTHVQFCTISEAATILATRSIEEKQQA
jgi:hypothetical protein